MVVGAASEDSDREITACASGKHRKKRACLANLSNISLRLIESSLLRDMKSLDPLRRADDQDIRSTDEQAGFHDARDQV